MDMYSKLMFGATELNIDPETLKDVNAVTLFVFTVLFLALVGLVIWKVAPFIHEERQKSRLAKRETANAIWFDHIESELHCGLNKMRIEPKSFEHFVCKIIFKTPSLYTKDLDIFDEADEVKGVKETKRGVEQAVRRLNKKTKALGLKEDLFKRSKERTSVNDEYRERIVNN